MTRNATHPKNVLVGVTHRGSVCASHPAAPGSILGIPKNFSETLILDVADINRRHFLKCGKLEYVYQTIYY